MVIDGCKYPVSTSLFRGNKFYEVYTHSMPKNLKKALTEISNSGRIVSIKIGDLECFGSLIYLGTKKIYIYK